MTAEETIAALEKAMRQVGQLFWAGSILKARTESAEIKDAIEHAIHHLREFEINRIIKL